MRSRWEVHTGGGGGVLPYVCILGMCRARDPHFKPWISVPEHIIFTNYQKNPFRSITIYNFLADFAVPETIIFKISLISTRSSPPTAGSVRTLPAAPRISGRSHAQNGSSSFRSPAFSSSKRLKLVSEPNIFTLDQELVPEPLPIFHFAAAHTYQNLGWVPPPPPPPPVHIYSSQWTNK